MKIVDQNGRRKVTLGRLEVRPTADPAIVSAGNIQPASNNSEDLGNHAAAFQASYVYDANVFGRVHVADANGELNLYGGANPILELTNEPGADDKRIWLILGGPSLELMTANGDGTILVGGDSPALEMLGNQVVGPQQTGVLNATGTDTLDDVKTLFNDLLHKLRNHGLIAPSPS